MRAEVLLGSCISWRKSGLALCLVGRLSVRDGSRVTWLVHFTLRPLQPSRFFVRLSWYTGNCKCMHWLAANFGHKKIRRALAVLGCVALLYFAAGGSFLHHHTGGPETVCHICQALHMPALAATLVKLVPAAQQVAWHEPLPQRAAPTDSFALHRASRAPPVA